MEENITYSKIESHEQDTILLKNNNDESIRLIGISDPLNDNVNKGYVDKNISRYYRWQWYYKNSKWSKFYSPDNGAFVVNGGVGIKKDLNVSGTIKGNVFTSTSDIRNKTNITEIEDSLGIIDNIRCTSYKMEDNRNHYGIIAQEILNIPELKDLVYRDSDDKLSVNYIDIIPSLIDSIKNK